MSESESLDAVITDPPYFDSVPYADLSDFFYVWLKRSIGHLYPEHFSGQLTPKKNEAIMEPSRHGGNKAKAAQAYRDMMHQAFCEASRVLKPNGMMVVVYAHKTTSICFCFASIWRCFSSRRRCCCLNCCCCKRYAILQSVVL